MNNLGELVLKVDFKNKNNYRPLLIYIGNELKKEILDNGTFNIALPPGDHCIYARTGFIKSKKLILTIYNGENAEVYISNKKQKWYKYFFAFLVLAFFYLAGKIIFPVSTVLISGSVVGLVLGYIFANQLMMNITLIKVT
jgi:hypothetical protein